MPGESRTIAPMTASPAVAQTQVNSDPRPQRQVRTARFIKRKETPGTCVYQEQPPEGEPEIIGNLYVRKWFAGSATVITVTVEKA